MPTKLASIAARGLAGLAVAALACGFAYITNSDTGLPLKWPPGAIPMHIMVDNTAHLSDGTTQATCIQAAMTDPTRGWNHNLGDAQFVPQILAPGSGADGNNLSEIFFSNSPYSMSWDTNTLAVTTAWYIGNQRVEADIIFNNTYAWDSYRGNEKGSPVDLQRIALHELGHVLGLDHPDDAGQTVVAIMNSHVSNIDSPTADDITGAQSLYGPPGVPANDNFSAAVNIILTGNSVTVTGFNTNATKEGVFEPNHGGNGGGRSVWWKWTSAFSGSVTLTTAGSVFDTTLGVYTGTAVNALTTIGSNDDVNPGIVQSSSVTFTAVAGTTYHFAVDGFNDNDGNGADSGAVTLNLFLGTPGGTTTTTIISTTSSTTTTTTIPPTSGGSSGGGGGGAFGGWFSGALALLSLLRCRLKKT